MHVRPIGLVHAGSLLSMLCVAAPAAGDVPVLNVYTYSTFVAERGPGLQIQEAFEAECDCRLVYTTADDGIALLSRLKSEGNATDADVVLGLDMSLVAEASELDLLSAHDLTYPEMDLPVTWDDLVFVPFDWGYFAFVYDSYTIDNPPTSLKALVEESEHEILVQDPRTSTPGLGLMLWMKSVYGDRTIDAWARLNDRIVSVTSGSSEAYDLFQEGEAPLVLSYSTSPAYHVAVEGSNRYQAAMFEEGHYAQIEVAAMTATSDHPDLARDFLAFLMSIEAQEILPATNWMYPIRNDLTLPDAFEDLDMPEAALLFDPETVLDNRSVWIDEWLKGMGL